MNEWNYANGGQPMMENSAARMGPMNGQELSGDNGVLPMKRSSTKRVGELEGEGRSEMDGMHTAQPPPAYPSELAGEGRAELPGA